MQYRIYLTDALRLTCENTAKIGGGSVMRERWADVIANNQRRAVRDTRPPEEIIADIAEKAGLEIV